MICSVLTNRDLLEAVSKVEVTTDVAVMLGTVVIDSTVPFCVPAADEASGAAVTARAAVEIAVGTAVGGGAVVFAVTMIWLRSSSASPYLAKLIRALARS